MTRCQRLEHRFVESIPEKLDAGVLYVSVEFCAAAHACCCGCGEEVVTPLSPAAWRVTFDGESVSLWPSIGNWSLPCRSHYVIERGVVTTALPWSDAQVEAGRRRDREARDRHYSTPPMKEPSNPVAPIPPASAPGWWTRLKRRLLGPK